MSTDFSWVWCALFVFENPRDDRKGGGVRSVYSHETRVALVKERGKEKERQKQRRIRSGTLILAALAVGMALGAAAACPRRGREKGG